jgi:hypothetical protein
MLFKRLGFPTVFWPHQIDKALAGCPVVCLQDRRERRAVRFIVEQAGLDERLILLCGPARLGIDDRRPKMTDVSSRAACSHLDPEAVSYTLV